MARRFIHSEPTSRLAIWARRTAGFALLASFLAIIIVRSGLLEIWPALATFAGALAIAVVALLLAFAAFVVIWMEGLAGMGAALTAMAVSIRVRAETDGARIDARSSSRYGSFDFGTNASRVRGLMNEIEDAIRAQRPERPPAQPSAKKSTPGKKDQSKK